jgi:hypothetical protein
VLGRSVRVMSTPAGVFAAAQSVLRPVAPSAANIMGLNRLMGTVETNWQTADVLAQLGVTAPRTVEEVLREKAGLPPG